jgi:hypothetical protein
VSYVTSAHRSCALRDRLRDEAYEWPESADTSESLMGRRHGPAGRPWAPRVGVTRSVSDRSATEGSMQRRVCVRGYLCLRALGFEWCFESA